MCCLCQLFQSLFIRPSRSMITGVSEGSLIASSSSNCSEETNTWALQKSEVVSYPRDNSLRYQSENE